VNEENNKNDRIHQLSRLRWACRRGMLELDVLLGNFLEEAYEKLPDEDKWLFISLLECADPDLNGWLMGSDQPPEPDLVRMVELIKHHAKNRF
jgi:antitoxin CptB